MAGMLPCEWNATRYVCIWIFFGHGCQRYVEQIRIMKTFMFAKTLGSLGFVWLAKGALGTVAIFDRTKDKMSGWTI